jgi:hypothetical protein
VFCGPVKSLSAKEERQPTDAEVRVAIGQQNRYRSAAAEFTRSQRRADTGVATTDDQEPGTATHFINSPEPADFPNRRRNGIDYLPLQLLAVSSVQTLTSAISI